MAVGWRRWLQPPSSGAFLGEREEEPHFSLSRQLGETGWFRNRRNQTTWTLSKISDIFASLHMRDPQVLKVELVLALEMSFFSTSATTSPLSSALACIIVLALQRRNHFLATLLLHVSRSRIDGHLVVFLIRLLSSDHFAPRSFAP